MKQNNIEIPEKIYHFIHNNRFLEIENKYDFRLFEKNENRWSIIKVYINNWFIAIKKFINEKEINHNQFSIDFYNKNSNLVINEMR